MAKTPVIARKRGCKIDVVNEGTPFAAGFEGLPFQEGISPVVIRFAGGCAGLTPDIIAAMPDFFMTALDGFNGVAFSGGTMNIETEGEGEAKALKTSYTKKGFTITYVPALLAERNACLAVSTTPRTDQMTLDPDFGGLVLTDSDDRIDYEQHHAVIVQADATEITEADWSKDVLPYLQLMQKWSEQDVLTAVVACNGGGVTWKEIIWALERGIHVFAIRGSGRNTDKFINEFEAGTLKIRDLKTGDDIAVDPSLVTVITFDNPQGFRGKLISMGYIPTDADGEEGNGESCCAGSDDDPATDGAELTDDEQTDGDGCCTGACADGSCPNE